MGMLDGLPFVPRTGAPVTFRKREYTLKWTTEHGRTLVNRRGVASYKLVEEDCICCRIRKWHFHVCSTLTGKRKGTMIVYMVNVVDRDPRVKRPWWHEPDEPFYRNARWKL